MPDLNSSYWNNRYLTNDFSWDLGAVSLPLKIYIDQLTDKDIRILIPGGGNSYEAQYLYEHGFANVYMLDFASQPLQNLKKRCPSFPPDQLLKQDFFEHHDQYDLIIEQTFFCAIDPSLRKRYVTHMLHLLNSKGKLAGLLFNDELNDNKPPFGGSRVEYESLFFPFFNKIYFEECYNSIKPRMGRELFILLEKP